MCPPFQGAIFFEKNIIGGIVSLNILVYICCYGRGAFGRAYLFVFVFISKPGLTGLLFGSYGG